MKSFLKEIKLLEDAAGQLLDLALKAGAESAEVCGSYGHKSKITLEKQDFQLASVDRGCQLGLRVMIGDKQGFASVNTVDKRELKELALRAVEIAHLAPPNPLLNICPSENIPEEAPSPDVEPSLIHFSLQTQKEWATLLCQTALKDRRFHLNDGAVAVDTGTVLVANSLGTHKTQPFATVHWGMGGMAIENDNITSMDGFQRMETRVENVPQSILTSVENCCARILAGLNTGKASSYKGRVVFSPLAVVEILLPVLSYHLNGRTLVEKTSRWNVKSLGGTILNTSLTLKDMPWNQDRFGFSLFDREGTPTKNHTLIESGQLKGFLIDNYSAKGLNIPSTGNASGGASALPSCAPHCLCVEKGQLSFKEWVQQGIPNQKEFLLIHRFSGQTDSVSGDFSGVAKSSEWWAGGEKRYCVKETLISGNVFEVLGKNLLGCSQETEVVDSQESVPYLFADGVSVTAG